MMKDKTDGTIDTGRRWAARAPALMAGLLALWGGPMAARASDPPERRDAVVEVVERVMPCVVNIATEEIVEYRDPFAQLFQEFWGPYYRRRAPDTRFSLGSGVIIDEEGWVLTNMHVVQRARRVWVQLSDGREFEAQPRIVGAARSDVALLQILAKEGEQFPTIQFATDEDLMLGETVLALGNPFGLGGSVSRGILSSKNRRPPRDDEPLHIADWLQTDAAINPGSSGGPLVNLQGKLIGLSVAVYREGQGIGFAIPVKQVVEALSEIVTPEVNQSLWFGGRLRPGSTPLRFTAVQPGSPAEVAGLKADDQLISVDGKVPTGFIEAVSLIGSGRDHAVTLVVRRGDRRETIKVALRSLSELIDQRIGLSVQELTPDLAKRFGFGARDGLLIADVNPDGPASGSDLRPGYLLVAMGGQPTADLLSAAGVLMGLKPGETLELTVAAWQQRGAFARLNRGTFRVQIR
jgi:serine protease Do